MKWCSRVAMVFVVLVGAGCAARGDGREEDVARAPAVALKKRRQEVYAKRVNRTLIYPVQHGRAEDLAATLQPLFEATYGPGVRVIPHEPTNHLLIYLPPFAERERRAAGGPRATPAPQASPR